MVISLKKQKNIPNVTLITSIVLLNKNSLLGQKHKIWLTTDAQQKVRLGIFLNCVFNLFFAFSQWMEKCLVAFYLL